jgi:hypothetical protein
MTRSAPRDSGYRFPPEIISHAVWLDYRLGLSFRDVEDLLAERGTALLHESNVARNDPDPVVGHRLIAYDAGLPKSLIRFSTLHARTASAPCPAELRARKPSPMMDLYRKKTFSTRACRW